MKKFKKIFLWVLASFIALLAFSRIYNHYFVDPFAAGMAAMKAGNYALAKSWMLDVTERHPKYDEAVSLLDEEKGAIGVALVWQGRAEMEKARDLEVAADKERSDKNFNDAASSAQYSCKDAAVKAAKWDGAESDFGNKSDVFKMSDDAIRVVGRDVKFVNGFGAKRYAEYVGIYNISSKKCTIIGIAN